VSTATLDTQFTKKKLKFRKRTLDRVGLHHLEYRSLDDERKISRFDEMAKFGERIPLESGSGETL
jgi:hypothetical protein